MSSRGRVGRLQRDREFGRPGRVPRELVQLPWPQVRTQVHPAIKDRFLLACELAAKRSAWVPRRCDGFAHRPIRGLLAPSMHGYALAWDFFATPPGVVPPGGVWRPENPPDLAFYEPFATLGFELGAWWRRVDLPHIEWARSIEHAPVKWEAL